MIDHSITPFPTQLPTPVPTKAPTKAPTLRGGTRGSLLVLTSPCQRSDQCKSGVCRPIHAHNSSNTHNGTNNSTNSAIVISQWQFQCTAELALALGPCWTSVDCASPLRCDERMRRCTHVNQLSTPVHTALPTAAPSPLFTLRPNGNGQDTRTPAPTPTADATPWPAGGLNDAKAAPSAFSSSGGEAHSWIVSVLLGVSVGDAAVTVAVAVYLAHRLFGKCAHLFARRSVLSSSKSKG